MQDKQKIKLRMRLSKVIIASIIILITILAYLLLGLNWKNQNFSSPQTVDVVVTKKAAFNSTKIKSLAKIYPPESIPRYGLPLVESIQSLMAASEAGNYRASCRLAASIRRCQSRDELFGIVGQITGELNKYQQRLAIGIDSDNPTVKAKAAELKNVEDDWARMCLGFEASMAKPAWHYQYVAATQGHIPSMTDFAFAPAMSDYDALNIIPSTDKLGWDFYQHDAALMLRHAADSGNIRAISILIQALQGRQGLGERGVLLATPDNVEAAKYAIIYHNLASEKNALHMEKTLLTLRKLLTREEYARAELEAKLLSAEFSKFYIDKQLRYTDIRYGQDDKCAQD